MNNTILRFLSSDLLRILWHKQIKTPQLLSCGVFILQLFYDATQWVLFGILYGSRPKVV